MTPPDRILFVCLHGAAKSVIAAHYLPRLAAERGLSIDAESAGVDPDAEIPPHVVAGLTADGFDVTGAPPSRVTPDRVAQAQYVVAFGCALPQLGRRRVADQDWHDVPAVSDGYAGARDAIVARLQALLDRIC